MELKAEAEGNTYLPINIAWYLDGHSFLAQELMQLGVAFRQDDNAILAVADLGLQR